jgi:hypothetical protein
MIVDTHVHIVAADQQRYLRQLTYFTYATGQGARFALVESDKERPSQDGHYRGHNDHFGRMLFDGYGISESNQS